MWSKIVKIKARQVLDSRGNPTLEAEVMLENGAAGRGIVPSGASTGKFEAVELRDGEKEYLGLGVEKAVMNVNTRIADKLIGMNALNQIAVDRAMIEGDGTENKGKYGANAILGVSIATAKAAAKGLHLPLYRYLGGSYACRIPVPMLNIINGGCHSKNAIDFQEYMIMPIGAENIKEALRMSTEIYHKLKTVLSEKGLSTGIGDEGGFAPDLSSSKEVFACLEQATKQAGYRVGEDIMFAMDAAASELYDETRDVYYFPGESRMKGKEICRNAEEMVTYYEDLAAQFPIYSIEDGLGEEDIKGWKVLTYRLGNKIQLVGDDLFVTNKEKLKKGIKEGVGNSILIKMNQIGTLTETMETIELAKRNKFSTVISHRSGETEDTTIADLAVAVNAGQIKCGAPCRSDRVAKYNRLLRIEEGLEKNACFYLDSMIR